MTLKNWLRHLREMIYEDGLHDLSKAGTDPLIRAKVALIVHSSRKDEDYVNRDFWDRLRYRLFGRHVWLYTKDGNRRWCNISDLQEQRIGDEWVPIKQPKRPGFI